MFASRLLIEGKKENSLNEFFSAKSKVHEHPFSAGSQQGQSISVAFNTALRLPQVRGPQSPHSLPHLI
jgi:hypothetical protein